MPTISPAQRDLLTLCALRANAASVDWYLVARVGQSPDGINTLLKGEVWEDSAAAR
jgi:DNA processing protein